jgi:hypothetical protein
MNQVAKRERERERERKREREREREREEIERDRERDREKKRSNSLCIFSISSSGFEINFFTGCLDRGLVGWAWASSSSRECL